MTEQTEFCDQLAPLVAQAKGARAAIEHAKTLADHANSAVERFLKGQSVIVTGTSHKIVTRNFVREYRKQFVQQRGRVTSVSYYYNQRYGFQNAIRIEMDDGSEWEFSAHDIEVMLDPTAATIPA